MSAPHSSYCGLRYYDTMLQSSQQAPKLQRNYYLQTAALYHNPDTILIFNLNLDNCNNSVNPKHQENHRSFLFLPSPLHSSSINNLSLSVLYAYLMFLFVSFFVCFKHEVIIRGNAIFFFHFLTSSLFCCSICSFSYGCLFKFAVFSTNMIHIGAMWGV